MKNLSDSVKWKKILILAAKIAIGSSLAIYIADMMELKYAPTAGIIALLTLITTKNGAVQLSIQRLLSFLVVELLTFVTFMPIKSEWIAYGLFTFLIVVICEMMGWRATVSVNAVIGTHFLQADAFTPQFFANEFMLVTVGIMVATVINLIQDNQGQKEHFARNIKRVEKRMQDILTEVAGYLANEPLDENKQSAWTDMSDLRRQLVGLLGEAWEYEENTFKEDGGYYVDYFEMRLDQCRTLGHLHAAMRKIKTIPKQAMMIEKYIRYLVPYVTELNVPEAQINDLEDIFAGMKKEPMPATREEFENRALLYHILMDLDEFLLVKKKFVDRHL